MAKLGRHMNTCFEMIMVYLINFRELLRIILVLAKGGRLMDFEKYLQQGLKVPGLPIHSADIPYILKTLSIVKPWGRNKRNPNP